MSKIKLKKWIKPNTLHLGDCLEVMKKIKSKSIDLVITDPPYEFIKKNPTYGGIYDKEKKRHLVEIDNIFGITYNPNAFLQELKRVSKKFNAYIFTNKNLLEIYIKFARENKYRWDIMIWSKPNPVPCNNGHYLIDKEYCMFIRESGAPFNSKLGYANYFTFMIYPIGKKETRHPTEKPLIFIEKFINISSNENDVVLDAYLGSGTTSIACINTNRKYIGIELNEKYFNDAKERIKEYE